MTENEFTLTKEFLKECFDYNPKTGVIVWKYRPRRHFKTDGGFNQFNNEHPGRVAGYIRKDRSGSGYRQIKINKIKYQAHRLILIMEYGYVPDHVDHINGDTNDNSLCNLRYANSSINTKNTKLNKNNKTGLMGVGWSKTNKAFIARIGLNGKHITLGQRVDFFEACCLRKSAELRFNYHPNHGRTE